MSNKLVTVATLEHINQAIMMKGWLDSAGIESFILDLGLSVEAAAQMEGQVELQVCEIDVSKALEVIENGNIPDKQETEFNTYDNQFINKILVPVDFSSYSLNAACYAAHVAQQKGAKITLIHVYFNPITNPISYDHFYSFPANVAETLNEIIEIARPLEKHITIVHIDETSENPFLNFDLAHFKEKYVGNVGSVEMDFDLIVNKNRSRGIENYIIDEKIDVIAITSHKRNIITSLFRPSLTKELLFRLEIPMLIFHPEIK